MVHALEKIRRLLKPAGTLIDIHPVAEDLPIEVHLSKQIALAGTASVAQLCLESRQAEEALAEVVERGLFVIEREGVFDNLTYYASVSEARAHVATDPLDRSEGEAVAQFEALAPRIEELMRAAGSGAEVVTHERGRITRLKSTR